MGVKSNQKLQHCGMARVMHYLKRLAGASGRLGEWIPITINIV